MYWNSGNTKKYPQSMYVIYYLSPTRFRTLVLFSDITTNIQIYFIINYVLMYVLMKYWCKLHDDGDNAETCRD
jgi:hypothetical protein